jgi:hypothetical protein
VKEVFLLTVDTAVRWYTRGWITASGLIAVYINCGGDRKWSEAKKYLPVTEGTYKRVIADVESGISQDTPYQANSEELVRAYDNYLQAFFSRDTTKVEEAINILSDVLQGLRPFP